MKGIFGKATELMERAIELRTRRNALLASNIANVDTPGYKPRDIPFKEIMARYLESSNPSSGLGLKKTHAAHMQPGTDQAVLARTREGHLPSMDEGPDAMARESRETGTPNPVDLDQEMARLAANNLEYQATVQALIKKLEILRTAITEGGKA